MENAKGILEKIQEAVDNEVLRYRKVICITVSNATMQAIIKEVEALPHIVEANENMSLFGIPLKVDNNTVAEWVFETERLATQLELI